MKVETTNSMNHTTPDFYHIDGPMPADCPSYIQRSCDEQVFQNLVRAESCWVVGSPQTGKSSLGIRTARRLRNQGVDVVSLDLKGAQRELATGPGCECLLREVRAQLGESEETTGSPTKSAQDKGGMPLVVILDDVERIRALSDASSEFFGALQELTSQSQGARHSGRVAFLFLGTAPAPELAPGGFVDHFGLQKTIELEDFTPEEAAALEPLSKGQAGEAEQQDSSLSLQWILQWTHGHPYLTQRLCLEISEPNPLNASLAGIARDEHWIDRVCEDLLLSDRAKDRDPHLRSVRERLKRKGDDDAEVLSLLMRIRNRAALQNDPADRGLIRLQEAGIVKAGNGGIRIRNRIYERVFDQDWAMAHFPILRPGTPACVAVMPFRDDDAGFEDEYWADGLTEELINALGQIPGLSVASPGSAFQFKGKPENLRELAGKLRVEIVLNGVVRRQDDRLRIFVELVSATNGYRLWSDSFVCRTKDVLEIQETITSAIAERLHINWQSRESGGVSGPPTENLEAYNFYLRGRFLWNKRQEASVRQSIGLFQDAIGLDPQFALAYAGLADAYNMLGTYNYVPPIEAYPRGKVAALKALEIDERLAATHAAFGCIAAIYDWDWAGAEESFQRGIELNPSYAPARQWYAVNCLTPLGRHEESLSQLRSAQAVDPLSLGVQASVALAYYYARDYDKAIGQCRFTLEMEERFWVIHLFSAWAHLQQSNLSEAIAACERACSLGRADPVALAALGHAHALAGDREKAVATLADLTKLAAARYVPAGELTFLCIGLGDVEQAFAWLQKAEAEKALRLIYLKVEPRFDPIRSDPRFQALLSRVGLAGELPQERIE